MASGPRLHRPALGAPEAEQRPTGARPWWDGRQVAIRPDVPGREFDAGDLILVRSDTERDQINGGIERFATELESGTSDDDLDGWLELRPVLPDSE